MLKLICLKIELLERQMGTSLNLDHQRLFATDDGFPQVIL